MVGTTFGRSDRGALGDLYTQTKSGDKQDQTERGTNAQFSVVQRTGGADALCLGNSALQNLKFIDSKHGFLESCIDSENENCRITSKNENRERSSH